nr:hypothetical protein [uncultured Dyadobacter sp.]
MTELSGRKWLAVCIVLVLRAWAGFAQEPAGAYVSKLTVNKARINGKTTELIRDKNKEEQYWVRLKENAENNAGEPDLVFDINVPEAGMYTVSSYAVPDEGHAENVVGADGKIGTVFVRMQFGGQRPTRRILYDAYNQGRQTLGKFEQSGFHQQLKIWLPKGIRLGHLELRPHIPPAVPTEAQAYKPRIVPPAGHPRLWMNRQSMEMVKERLTRGENRTVWDQVQQLAKVPFQFEYDPQEEQFHHAALEKAAETKAFHHLMTGDMQTGREAVELMVHYLSVLEFGNVKHGDITREVGRAIYAAAIVYDWCYPLLSAGEREQLYKHMMRLAAEMEIGWPPFDDSIINGHGNEAQICRDLLAMGIALYDQDPEPYRYTSYTVLEQLVPMRKFEYQSPRHNQGVDYGAYRFNWEMHAAWFYYRMTGTPVFDDNIKDLGKYWLNLRLPDGEMLRDGDVFNVERSGKPYYWKHPQTMLLHYAYAGDPVMKAEFRRQGGLPDNPVLFLLVNDPELQPEPRLDGLPQTIDFGPVLGSMIARTGWDMSPQSNDVVAEIKGGGYHFGNHQHADAGALQIYYRGRQVGDLGLYLSYGTDYDFNFNKRSISHSMMLAVDPEEKLLFRTKVNDGGSRFSQRFPKTPQEVTSDTWFHYGTVMSGSFGPSTQQPAFSYFKADLTAAYSAKMSRYTRGFCFLNLGRKDVPAAVILTDDMTTADPSFKKYWQINALNLPVQTDSGVVLSNEKNGSVGKTHVQMLVPSPSERTMQIMSGPEANSTFGHNWKVNSKQREATGHRIMVSPGTARKQDRFLTVFQMVDGDTKPLPIDFKESGSHYVIRIADRVVVMASGADDIQEAFEIHIPGDGNYLVTVTGIKSGKWKIEGPSVKMETDVNEQENTIFFNAKAGAYRIVPEG